MSYSDPVPTKELVQDRIEDINEITQDALTQLNSFITIFKSALNVDIPFLSSVDTLPFTPIDLNVDADPPEDITSQIDSEMDSLAPFSSTITIDPIDLGKDISVNPFSTAPPALTQYSPPSELSVNPPTEPTITPITIPPPPNLESKIPTVPTLQNINIPTVYHPQSFNFAPINPSVTVDLIPPTLAFTYTDSAAGYTSSLKSAIEAKLYNDVVNGGTGLADDVIDDIWEKREAQEEIAQLEQIEATLDIWSSRGLTLPDGALQAAVDEILEKRALDRLTTARDISYKQADLAQSNTQFAVTQGVLFEQIMLQHASNVAERALRAAIAYVELGKAAYQMKIDYFNSQFAQYQLGAQVLEANLRGELLKLEASKQEIEGAKLENELQTQILNKTRLEIECVNIYVEIYKRDVEAARLEADIQKNTIEIYRVSTEAYVAQVNAKAAEYNLFKAKQDSNLALIQVYAEQVRAYAAEADAVKSQAGIIVAKAEAQNTANKGKIEQIQAEIATYKASADMILGKIGAITEKYKAQAQIYGHDIAKATEFGRLQIEQSKIVEQGNAANLQLKLQAAIQNLQAFVRIAEVEIEAGKGGSQVFAALVSSAMQAINASMSISSGYSAHDSNSVGYSYSGSYPTTTSLPSPEPSVP